MQGGCCSACSRRCTQTLETYVSVFESPTLGLCGAGGSLVDVGRIRVTQRVNAVEKHLACPSHQQELSSAFFLRISPSSLLLTSTLTHSHTDTRKHYSFYLLVTRNNVRMASTFLKTRVPLLSLVLSVCEKQSSSYSSCPFRSLV